MKRFILIHILICTIAFAFTSCKDESVTDIIGGEGSAKISATLDFRPMSTGLAQTKADGDALKDISALYVLLYDSKTNKLVYSQEITEYTEEYIKRNDTDAENNLSAEAETKHLSFELDEIPYGAYYMYAVANIPDLLTTYETNIQSVDALKSLPLTWDAEDISNNGQMIGYFTKKDVVQQENIPLVLNAPKMELHAWLRRAASKVTIAYDGSNLKEGVFIYIESVQIKDIPSQCYLGKENNVGGEGYDLEYPKNGTDMKDGEIIKYHEEGEHESDDFEYREDCIGHRVTVGSPHLGSHDETAPALYFYENMQGAGENMPDKRQDADGDGELDHPGLPIKDQYPLYDKETYPNYRLKDAVPYGTYIEVKGHYISNNLERLGNGNIVYRFMLGQNIKNDYNAKRNCHYKLTLKFKNFANEADWHIEYEEPIPGVMAPEPYYISYLYNHSMMYPFKVNTGGHEIEEIKAEIIENRWAPYNAVEDNVSNTVYYADANVDDALWNGFLSLHKISNTILEKPTNKPDDNYLNKYYYDGYIDNKSIEHPELGKRIYTDFTEGEHTTEGVVEYDDNYRVEKHKTEENTYNIYIPMYTNAKQMIIWSGYTGNNPYETYQRKARIKLTTKLKDIETPFVNIVPIYQVRRIVNPKGIYRSKEKTTPFHVVLKHLSGEKANFTSFQSEGPWKAYIESHTNGEGITLSPTLGKSESKSNVIHGKTGSVIDFYVNFSESSEENRYAIICVEYHNYTCQHLIFVRQGDQPDNLVENGTKWYAMNMRTKSELASTPLDEGSLFKFGNWDQPIDALNNKNSRSPWINVVPTDFNAPGPLTIAGKKPEETTTWENITNKSKGENFDSPELPNARVAQFKDFWEFRSHSNIEQGYGVLYGDDATETADNIEDAYGYDYENNSSGRGMRGCFVYNSDTGKSLFFPIGASGYGHRKNSFTQDWGDAEKLNGVLRYASGRTKWYNGSDIGARPLLYDIFKRPGAIYWWDRQYYVEDNFNDWCLGWDINYYTFDFNHIGTNNLIHDHPDPDKSDACFIRCVED